MPDPASDRPILTGTSAALARRFAVSALTVRIAFVLLSVAWGLGIALYLAAWLVLGRGSRWVDGPQRPAGPVPTADPQDAGRNLGFGLVVLGVLVASVGAGWAPAAVWPAAIVATGVAVAWRRGSGARDPERVIAGDGDDRGSGAVGRDLGRQAVGMALVLCGLAVLLFSRFSFAALRDGVIAGLVVTVGLALVLGPWMLRSARAVIEERRERVRSEEREAMAAHLHDSVLQTLTLIQKRSSGSADPDAREVASLARRQERELRRWLYGRPGENEEGRFRATVDAVVADVEDLHSVTVEAVVVGDAPMDPGLEALAGALREALVNAAKFSGCSEVSLFAEVGGPWATAFVRDRGVGFDPDDVPADRHGLADSIVARVHRCGGTAEVRSRPGEGTEIELRVPVGGSPGTSTRSDEPGAPAGREDAGRG